MAPKKPIDPAKLLEQFQKQQHDAATVHNVPQRMEIHITATDAYLTSYSRQVMNQDFGAPVMAVYTKTDIDNFVVHIYPARDPEDKEARKLRSSDGLGPAVFAFGVPLRKLKLKLPRGRRYILPLRTLEVPELGTVYWVSFADVEHELRKSPGEAAKPSPNKQPPTEETAASEESANES